MDVSTTLRTDTVLSEILFKTFYIDTDIDLVKFSVNIEMLSKIFKLYDKNDIALYCYIEKTDKNYFVIRFKNENKNKKIFKLPLVMQGIKNNSEIMLDYEQEIKINSNLFFNSCKEISNVCEFVEINSDSENIKFKSIDKNNSINTKEGEIILNNNEEQIEINNITNKNVSGTYELKNILLFNKLGTLADYFSLYMKNDQPLVTLYSFGELGNFMTILSPINEDYENNKDYDYSDGEDEEEYDYIENNNNNLDF